MTHFNQSEFAAHAPYGDRTNSSWKDAIAYPDRAGEALNMKDRAVSQSYDALVQRLNRAGQHALRAAQREMLKLPDTRFEMFVKNRAERSVNQLNFGPGA